MTENSKRRVYSWRDLAEMSPNDYRMLQKCIESKSFRLLGIHYERNIRCYEDVSTGDFIIEWDW
jgi:hypothetical protein